jgi:hypothetical protein
MTLYALSPNQCFIATDRACTSTGTTTRWPVSIHTSNVMRPACVGTYV